MRSSRHHPNRNDFIDGQDYSRALREAGGPGADDLDALRHMTGFDAEVMRATYGQDAADLSCAVEAEHAARRAKRPQAFVDKYRPPRGRGKQK